MCHIASAVGNDQLTECRRLQAHREKVIGRVIGDGQGQAALGLLSVLRPGPNCHVLHIIKERCGPALNFALLDEVRTHYAEGAQPGLYSFPSVCEGSSLAVLEALL